jgi:hypothetical protein
MSFRVMSGKPWQYGNASDARKAQVKGTKLVLLRLWLCGQGEEFERCFESFLEGLYESAVV